MAEQGFLERHPDAPLAIYKPHNLPSGMPCPLKTVDLSHAVSTEHEKPIYICPWINPGSEERCGARFDKDGNPA